MTQQRKAVPIAQRQLRLGADPAAKKYAQQILNDVSGQLETVERLSQSG